MTNYGSTVRARVRHNPTNGLCASWPAKALLLGLEFLVAADGAETFALEPTAGARRLFGAALAGSHLPELGFRRPATAKQIGRGSGSFAAAL